MYFERLPHPVRFAIRINLHGKDKYDRYMYIHMDSMYGDEVFA